MNSEDSTFRLSIYGLERLKNLLEGAAGEAARSAEIIRMSSLFLPRNPVAACPHVAGCVCPKRDLPMEVVHANDSSGCGLERDDTTVHLEGVG